MCNLCDYIVMHCRCMTMYTVHTGIAYWCDDHYQTACSLYSDGTLQELIDSKALQLLTSEELTVSQTFHLITKINVH